MRQSMVFDDTYEHEAWNDSDGDRVVLFLDFERPMRRPASWVNHGVLAAVARSPQIRAARRRHAAQEEQLAAAWTAAGHLSPAER